MQLLPGQFLLEIHDELVLTCKFNGHAYRLIERYMPSITSFMSLLVDKEKSKLLASYEFAEAALYACTRKDAVGKTMSFEQLCDELEDFKTLTRVQGILIEKFMESVKGEKKADKSEEEQAPAPLDASPTKEVAASS